MQHTRARAIAEYIQNLTIGQGRHAGERFKLLGWQRRFLAGAFGQPDDAALSCGRAAGKTTLCAAIGCAAVAPGGPLVEPMGECLLVASSFDQGLIAFRHMLHFLQPTFEQYGTGPRGRFSAPSTATEQASHCSTPRRRMRRRLGAGRGSGRTPDSITCRTSRP